ncbi:urease accessory protein UreD [Plantactinospora sp. KBS50]|uniref:urease accessory protein UreD n=1 Tax=Plantactinospora sp. KBS50 TaxID=2024580 RepID=UPI000BAAAA6D|nr:urease accessory protein UreD [Plantactinospora sp. KBS50]ASW54850.1 urease accessory protein UreD [Plantactinospora sp. KBS50]
MRARARVVAEADGRGGTRLTRMRGETPLLLRRTGPAGGPATVHLVGGAAGPLGGDDLRLDLEVGPGATLCLGTVAASVALPARSGAGSRFTVRATVAGGGTLHWLPEQTVAAARCRHRTDATVELAESATLLWRDELVCGRHAEPAGEVEVSTRVRYADRPLLHQTLAVGGAPGWDGPAVLGGAKATGSLLRVGPDAATAPRVIAPTAVRVPLTGPACLVVATADSAHLLRGYLSGAAGPECGPRCSG